MGLDTVELVLATENHFDLEIPDRVAETLTTVGQLHGFVVAELERLGRPRDAAAVFTELHQLICELKAAGVWNIVLTPNYNDAHRNHFHVDLTTDSDFIKRVASDPSLTIPLLDRAD